MLFCNKKKILDLDFYDLTIISENQLHIGLEK